MPSSMTLDWFQLLMNHVSTLALSTVNESSSSAKSMILQLWLRTSSLLIFLLDMIDEFLFIPMKRQGFLDMYNGVDVLQIWDYIKISCTTFINKICKKYLTSWMQSYTTTADRPTPLPTDPAWYKGFNTAIGNPDAKHQAQLKKKM